MPPLNITMNVALAGRVAVVTGASRGIGRAIAVRLAAEGALIAVSYRRQHQAAEQVVAEITRSGGTAVAYQASVDDPAAVTAMLEGTRRDLGPVSIVVSNAGTASRGAHIATTPIAEFESLLRVHALGPISLIQAALPSLRAAGRGDVVLISSNTVGSAPAGGAPYAMAKAAMETCIRTLAREERPHGVHANIVAPGLVATEMGRRLVKATTAGGSLDDLAATYPFGRVCQPEDVAATVLYLVSSDASYLTGQRIVVDGGGADVAIV
jgi:NAD(P)-dependent dehydrogenase (short-subunit alcohol dehydrogenase family)